MDKHVMMHREKQHRLAIPSIRFFLSLKLSCWSPWLPIIPQAVM